MPVQDRRTRERISKRLAGLLRHYGPQKGVRIDEEGWAKIPDVIKALRGMGYNVSWEDIIEIVKADEKGRYEIRGDRIRARYGHSIRVKIQYPEATGVEKLYHGTPARNLDSIMRNGLLPGKRLYVHLSPDPETALETGERHGRPVAILEVNMECLKRLGIPVYKATSKVYLVERVPPQCLRLVRIVA
jgi:putative RNA 2'-phosphotransferase